MSARDVLAASLYDDNRTIAGKNAMPMTWDEYRRANPEGAMVYETQAMAHFFALRAAGYTVVETALLRELADDLAEHIAAHYGGSVGYPGMDRKRNRDMEPVNRARAMLAAVEADHD